MLRLLHDNAMSKSQLVGGTSDWLATPRVSCDCAGSKYRKMMYKTSCGVSSIVLGLVWGMLGRVDVNAGYRVGAEACRWGLGYED